VRARSGVVIWYNYLWAREHDRHEETGRRARPACVQIIVERVPGATVVALFPITTGPPQVGRTSLEIPEAELRRVGLAVPSWIIVDEWNLDNLAKSPHIADSRPLGAFSTGFMKRVRAEAAARIRARRYRSVPRRS
jgi:hypothetical protein